MEHSDTDWAHELGNVVREVAILSVEGDCEFEIVSSVELDAWTELADGALRIYDLEISIDESPVADCVVGSTRIDMEEVVADDNDQNGQNKKHNRTANRLHVSLPIESQLWRVSERI